MITSFRKTTLKWALAALALSLVVGCSSTTSQQNSVSDQQNSDGNSAAAANGNTSSGNSNSPSGSSSTSSPTLVSQAARTLLSNMKQAAQQGRVINSNFPVKSVTIEDVEKSLGPADSTDYVAAAKGRYATFSSHQLVFGINKGEQIFEVRSFDNRLSGISLADVKAVFGTPAYDATVSGQEIIGYTAGSSYKIELVFPQPTSAQPNPVMDHYSVLYPAGTVNSMAEDPGRQW